MRTSPEMRKPRLVGSPYYETSLTEVGRHFWSLLALESWLLMIHLLTHIYPTFLCLDNPFIYFVPQLQNSALIVRQGAVPSPTNSYPSFHATACQDYQTPETCKIAKIIPFIKHNAHSDHYKLAEGGLEADQTICHLAAIRHPGFGQDPYCSSLVQVAVL